MSEPQTMLDEFYRLNRSENGHRSVDDVRDEYRRQCNTLLLDSHVDDEVHDYGAFLLGRCKSQAAEIKRWREVAILIFKHHTPCCTTCAKLIRAAKEGGE